MAIKLQVKKSLYTMSSMVCLPRGFSFRCFIIEKLAGTDAKNTRTITIAQKADIFFVCRYQKIVCFERRKRIRNGIVTMDTKKEAVCAAFFMLIKALNTSKYAEVHLKMYYAFIKISLNISTLMDHQNIRLKIPANMV